MADVSLFIAVFNFTQKDDGLIILYILDGLEVIYLYKHKTRKTELWTNGCFYLLNITKWRKGWKKREIKINLNYHKPIKMVVNPFYRFNSIRIQTDANRSVSHPDEFLRWMWTLRIRVSKIRSRVAICRAQCVVIVSFVWIGNFANKEHPEKMMQWRTKNVLLLFSLLVLHGIVFYSTYFISTYRKWTRLIEISLFHHIGQKYANKQFWKLTTRIFAHIDCSIFEEFRLKLTIWPMIRCYACL